MHFSEFNDNAETLSYVTVDNGACVTTKLRQNLKITKLVSAFLGSLLSMTMMYRLGKATESARNVLNSNISAYRKGHSTTTVLQAIRDDTVKAMKRSEVTMMILADFSKAFDTICFRKLITKMSKLGFSRNYLIWTLNYVMHRKQFVQIDDTCSEVKNVNLGFPKAPSWARCYSIFMLLIFRTM